MPVLHQTNEAFGVYFCLCSFQLLSTVKVKTFLHPSLLQVRTATRQSQPRSIQRIALPVQHPSRQPGPNPGSSCIVCSLLWGLSGTTGADHSQLAVCLIAAQVRPPGASEQFVATSDHGLRVTSHICRGRSAPQNGQLHNKEACEVAVLPGVNSGSMPAGAYVHLQADLWLGHAAPVVALELTSCGHCGAV